MLRYAGKKDFIAAVREMNRIGIEKNNTTDIDGQNAEKFVEALGDRKFHQESVKCPAELEITLHDAALNAVWVAFEHGAINLTTIDCRKQTAPRDAYLKHKDLTVEKTVQLIDEFFASMPEAAEAA
jgi:hypothetical protein